MLRVVIMREEDLAAQLAAAQSAESEQPENVVEAAKEAVENVVEAVTGAVESVVEKVAEAIRPGSEDSGDGQ
jgi:hypothetical protein